MQSGWLLASLMSTSFMETRRLTEASCWITLVRSKSSYTPQFIITDLPAKVTFSSGLEQQQISITLSFWRHLWFCCQWAFNRSLLPFWLLGIPGYLNQVRGWEFSDVRNSVIHSLTGVNVSNREAIGLNQNNQFNDLTGERPLVW